MKRTLSYIPLSEIRRVRNGVKDAAVRAHLLADIFRLNTLYMIARAGSGHIGTSLSSLDIVTWLWTAEMTEPNETKKEHADLYFSSKGHDAPALYSLLIGLEKLPFSSLHKLRRLGGLPGHPDVDTPYLLTNTGPLGMGISKARGMALARRLSGKTGKIFVLTGDGELQEGQIWESLQPATNQKMGEITVIVDCNKIQSDLRTEETSSLGDLARKFASFGWEVAECDGHDISAMRDILARFRTITDRPQILIAHTVKGKGVSFMEEIPVGLYRFHSGAPSEAHYEAALAELAKKIDTALKAQKLKPLELTKIEAELPDPFTKPERLVKAYSEALVQMAKKHGNIVGLDGDLLLDTGMVPFKEAFPGRYVECGIAEQDMVSAAGGLALAGKLPIVHSFACFLSTRPNEQIYNNATEKTKIIYTAPLAGLLPAVPGHSHQSVRDISALGSTPGLVMFEPCSETEVSMALSFAVKENKESTYLRLASIPWEIPFALPKNYRPELGKGVMLRKGKDAAIIAYGPVMLSQAYQAAEKLEKSGLSVAVFNMPWLNRLDEKWFKETFSRVPALFTIDDHYVELGQGTMLAAAAARLSLRTAVTAFGVTEIPACGWPQEVLQHHGLDADSLAQRILRALKKKS